MTDFARAFHDLVFERDFAILRGDAFQDFFADIMEKRYPGDFVRVRPWGNLGDWKNDGYRTSTSTVYQCYGPNDMTAAEAVNKIKTDFAGAKSHWPQMKEWRFVHNAWDGLSAPVLAALNDLRTANPGISIEAMGRQELLVTVRELAQADRDLILGPAPDVSTFTALGFSDLVPVIEAIEGQPMANESGVLPVPPEKLAHNRLGSEVEQLLHMGKRRYELVDRFFAQHPNPALGDQIGKALTTQYRVLKGRGLPPDLIFFQLQSFALGDSRATPEREAAGLSVLAYFFEQCDIFERPPVQPA